MVVVPIAVVPMPVPVPVLVVVRIAVGLFPALGIGVGVGRVGRRGRLVAGLAYGAGAVVDAAYYFRGLVLCQGRGWGW